VSGWLDPLREVLDGGDEQVQFFFRDDDAGWDDRALERLLDVFEAHGLPLDVAAIPAAMSTCTVELLLHRSAAGRNDLTVHQHGFAHLNHEPEGRKCEFGLSRSRQQQTEDVAQGRALLHKLVGDVPAVFTPPWNRCTSWTGEVLRDLGFEVLSRDLSAGSTGVAGLRELPVTVDWFAKRKKLPVSAGGRGELLAESARGTRPVGVMLHHEVMTHEDLADLGMLLALVASHSSASAGHLHELALAHA
jgi:peptidoglycan/xylan/chitin deacetylase (PgdA/CDA1 family)